MKKLIPVFALALGVLGAFAFTNNGSTEEVVKIGYFDADNNILNGCEIQYDCGPLGNLCFETHTGTNLPVFQNTNCTVQLKMLQ